MHRDQVTRWVTQTITIQEGRANVFVAVEHANSEVVGIHASWSANRFEALGPVRQARVNPGWFEQNHLPRPENAAPAAA
jgi:hypothetical protein